MDESNFIQPINCAPDPEHGAGALVAYSIVCISRYGKVRPAKRASYYKIKPIQHSKPNNCITSVCCNFLLRIIIATFGFNFYLL